MSVADVVGASLEAYATWEPQLHAFAWCDPELVARQAREADRCGPTPMRFLHGIPVGVKDVFDTAGIPTEYGSPVFKGRVPTQSAVAVNRLVAAGAVVIGKTVTSELAYYAPGPTTNPWNVDRTPGGSSMGSAAAVAAGVVPAAMGTQTNGSVIRPAAFCGVVGYKPSAGLLPRSGVLRFSPALDQVGVIAADVSLAARVAAVLADENPSDWDAAPTDSHPVLGIVQTPEWVEAEPAMRDSFDTALAAADAAGASLHELKMPEALAAAIPIHRLIMAAEAHRWIRPLVAAQIDRCSTELRELLDEGERVDDDTYLDALKEQRRAVREFQNWTVGFDALLTLSVVGEAPSRATTGDPRCCTRWTLLGAPALTLPNGLGPSGLPLSIQLVGAQNGDRRLLWVARWLQRMLPETGSPPLQARARRGS